MVLSRFVRKGTLEVALMLGLILMWVFLFQVDLSDTHRAIGGFLFSLLFIGTSAGFPKKRKPPVLMIGDGAVAERVLAILARDRSNGYGVIHSRWDNTNPNALTEEWNRLNTIFKDDKIERVVVALDNRRSQLPVEPLLSLRVQGVQIVDAASFYEEVSGRIPVEFLKPGDLIFCDGFKRSNLIHAAKRGTDLFFSTLGLIASLPFFLVLSALVRIDSKGPVFYSQERVGRKGTRFNVMKFRTMVDNAEGASGPVWAGENDPRVTRLGRFMRKYRLDEIPQLINIFTGEMSFVGPRPERPVFVQKLRETIPFYDLRSTVKPGLTGWAQVRFPYSSTLQESQDKFGHDLYYIKHLSPLFDLAIIADTVRVVLTGQGSR